MRKRIRKPNLVVESLKIMPKKIFDLVKTANQKNLMYRKGSEVLDPTPKYVKLDMSIRHAPKRVGKHVNPVFTWHTHCMEADAPYLIDADIEHDVLCCSAPFVICLDWYALNSYGEYLDLDVDDEKRYEQTFSLTPRVWNGIRKTFRRFYTGNDIMDTGIIRNLNENVSDIKVIDQYWLDKFFPYQVSAVVETEDRPDEIEFEHQIQYLKYSALQDLRDIRKHIHSKMTVLPGPSVFDYDFRTHRFIAKLRECRELEILFSSLIFE